DLGGVHPRESHPRRGDVRTRRALPGVRLPRAQGLLDAGAPRGARRARPVRDPPPLVRAGRALPRPGGRMSRPFVHLHLHSEYSLVDSVVRLGPLVEAAAAAGMPAVALTDQSNLFAAVKFQRAALAAGIQPILGVDLLVEYPDDPEAPTRVVLLAQNRAGYLNLTHLVSRSYTDGQHRGEPRIQREWLTGHS